VEDPRSIEQLGEGAVIPFECKHEGYMISTDPGRLDVDAVHSYLTRSYWAKGISKEVVAKSIKGSLCFGLFEGPRQIGLARVITDKSTFAYLCDVYVLEDYRNRGLGKWLVNAVRAHPDLQKLRRFVLLTQDAHGLYEQFGFTRLTQPDMYMEVVR
jgi:N-acetylglutamate synthase-like GNAT family acetyltransferase